MVLDTIKHLFCHWSSADGFPNILFTAALSFLATGWERVTKRLPKSLVLKLTMNQTYWKDASLNSN
jgi:hypothetical protein